MPRPRPVTTQRKKVAVATSSQGAADAAAEISESGGNAVDCAIAAAMYSINTEPGVCALAGSAYATVWPANQSPCTIDGNVAVPGAGLTTSDKQTAKSNARSVRMQYGGGIETVVGGPSVAVPGTPAALQLVADRYGSVAWRELLRPTIRAARHGFSMSAACHYYLKFSGDSIYSRSADGYAAVHDQDGNVRAAGSKIFVPHLADSLTALAEEGCRVFYEGDLAAAIVEHVSAGGGMLTRDDLLRYTPQVRDSLLVEVNRWKIATNPPPAIGGAVLAAMLLAFERQPIAAWDKAALRFLVEVQENVLSFRKQRLDLCDDVPGEAAHLLKLAHSGELLSQWMSGSTVHTSAVDDSGLCCAITASSGYGSGEMPAGTGLWLNNCLGELELNRRGLDAGPPGTRLPSNMAPSAARSGDALLAVGSPGADRITTALHQFLINYMQLDLSLADAIAHPRLHLEIGGETMNIAVEPGLDPPDCGKSTSRYPDKNMYFGGVVAASFDPLSGLAAAADPRREGGTFVS